MLPPIKPKLSTSRERMPFRHIGSTILLATSFILAAGALVTWAIDQQLGPWAPSGVVVVTADPSASPGTSVTPQPDPSDPAARARTTPPPLPPVDPSLLIPSVAGDPVRVLVSGVWINLPVVHPPASADSTPRFPWCRVADWMPSKGKADGKTGVRTVVSSCKRRRQTTTAGRSSSSSASTLTRRPLRGLPPLQSRKSATSAG